MEPVLNEAAINFLLEHDLGVLSTVSADGVVLGSAVYYLGSQSDDQEVYVITRAQSTKSTNIQGHQQVALTIYDAPAMQTLQLAGNAQIINDHQQLDKVFQVLIHPRPYQGEMLMPPVVGLDQGEYVLVKIIPTRAHFSDYKDIVRNAG